MSGVSPVAEFCLKGTAGKPGSLTFSGQAKREPKTGADGMPTTDVTVTPHGRGVMKLLEAKPAQFRGTPEPVGAPRRTASGVSDDGHNVAGSVPLFAAVSFEGTFVDGKRDGWGVLSRTRYEGGTAWSVRTIKCNWLSDVPQLLSDPCTIISEMEESGSSRVKSIFCGLAMAVRDADVGREQARSRSGSTTKAGGAYRPDASMSTAAMGGYSSGLSWVLSTAFFPDALGELIDYTQNVRYCGEFQCGLRHGFGIVTSLSSHAVHYMGQFESDVRQGAGTSIDDDRQLVFDGMWADGAIAAAGGTMHLPLPAPQAIQGQKWTDATTVGTGFLVNVRSAHTGMWEPLLSPLDESLPQLIESLEKLGSDLAASPDASPSAAASPTRVSIRTDAAGNSADECAGDEWQREAAVALSRFESLFDRVTRVRRELERVRLTACHALSLGVAKRALATFQRCLLFLFGSCGTRPILECGAGGSMDDPGTYATSWCRLTSRSFPGFECCHRVRGGTPVSPATILRFVQTASSLVMSLRLRLMTCHGAAQGSAPISQHVSPARHGYASSPRRPESTCARDGTPSRAALSEVADSETAGRPSGQTAAHTGTAPLDRTCPTCAHCALSVWIERATACPKGVDCGEALDVGGFAMLADAAAATLSGCPLQSTSSRLIATAWDVVAAACVPVALAVARPAFSRQTGQFEVAVRRLRLAALRSLTKDAASIPKSELRKMADVRVVCLSVPEAFRATACVIHGDSDASKAALAQRAASLGFALCDASIHPGDDAGVIQIIATAMRSVAEGLLAPALGGADSVADAHRADTTDVGPMFTYSSSPPLSRGAPSAATGRASTGSPRASSSGGSSTKTAGSSSGFISSRIEAITRLVIFARAFAFTLLGEAATADSAEKFTISLIHTALFFAHDPAHPVDPVAWLHLLLRVAAAPATVSMVMGSDVECAHDGYASFVDEDARAEASPQVSRVDAAAVTIGPLPAFCHENVAVVSFELSAVGAWALHSFAAAVASMTDTSRGVTGRDPAGSAPYAAVVDDLEALFDDHLTVPANILGSGCATRRPAEGDDGHSVTDAATTFSSGRLPSEYVVPTAPRIRREMRSRAAIVRDFLDGGLTERVPGAEEGGRSIESEDRVLVAVMDWALAVVGEHSVAPTRPQTRVFSLRRPEDGAKAYGDAQAGGSDSDSEPARSPAAGMSPAPVGIPKEMDPTPSTPASVVDAAMRRCYGGAEPELRDLRLKPLRRVLQHLGLDLVVVEQRGGSPSRPSTHDDFGSPGLVNIDPHSALHLRIELGDSRAASDATASAADPELVPARRGALRLAPILVERVLNRWRQLRHRVELSAPTE